MPFSSSRRTSLSLSTGEPEEAGAAGSTDIKGDLSVVDDPSMPTLALISSIRLRASSQVSLTSWAGSTIRLFFKRGTLPSKPIAPRASAASWRTIGCKERSLRTDSKAGMASMSCI
uniref:Uncharacterized protein MANES_05G087500 n=1 Tax=Rhizophora mucronata TaxID=61149 RepID=A0A2P2IZV0_RHIMU